MEDWREFFSDPMESAGAFMARASRMKESHAFMRASSFNM